MKFFASIALVALLPLFGLPLFSGSAALASASPSASGAAAVVVRHGVPEKWLVEADGTVFLQVGSGEEGAAWFEMRPDVTAGAPTENMILDIVVAATVNEIQLTAEGDRERALDGSSPDSAFPLRRLSHP